jgi:hypothetical protein
LGGDKNNELIERVRDFEPKVAAFDLFQRHINARAELPETAAEIVEFRVPPTCRIDDAMGGLWRRSTRRL